MGILTVVAIGGNSLIRDSSHQTVEDQYDAVCETAKHIVSIIEMGHDVIVTHGNGPQVGFILRRSDIASEVSGMHKVPLAICGADTQGSIGYQIQQAIDNEFRKRGIAKSAVTIVTQVAVDVNDVAFQKPTKPIGSYYTEELAYEAMKQHPDWVMVEDAGRGYRRVVASPIPQEILEKDAIELLARAGYCVIGVGGGGIPVVWDSDGTVKGVEAVIDKDYASSLLATLVGADVLVISTSVEAVCIHFGKPDEQALRCVTLTELKQYIREGHFAPGSMLPKMKAALAFLEKGGKRVIVTNPESLAEAVLGKAGTNIYPMTPPR